jgi:DNA-binding IclR family transcriptional regulator
MIQNTTTASYEANIRPKKSSLEAQIRRLLTSHAEGLTNREVAKLLDHPFPSTISGIVRPMVREGKVYESGERKCRVSGNTAKVWRLTSLKAATAPQSLLPNQSRQVQQTLNLTLENHQI